ncbi:MAG: ABC transporter permease [Flavobacteriales bacterium]|nr:ABC transporter permease [Flavobacteriales bacterium]
MNKIWLIIKREYLVRVKKRSFIVMTFLGPIIFGLLIFGAVAVVMSDSAQYHVLVVDETGMITTDTLNKGHLEARFWRNTFRDSADAQVLFDFTDTRLDDASFETSPYNLQMIVDESLFNSGRCQLIYKRNPSEMVSEKLERELELALEQARVEDSLKIAFSEYQRAKVNVEFAMANVKESDKQSLTAEKAGIGFMFAVLIYLFIFLYGVQVMRGVIEEKTNRIVEVIVSSVKPFQLMMGKVIGIGLVGLTQFLMWVVFSSIISTLVFSLYFGSKTNGQAYLIDNAQQMATGYNPALAQMQMMEENTFLAALMDTNWPMMIGIFIFFFIGGYLLYGSLFAAIGAAVDSETDTQQFMMPVTLPLIFSYVVAAMLITNPDSGMANFFSVFPLTSPIVMMVKTSIGVSPWIMLLSVVVLIATFVFMIWVAGRIYRVGILMYGKKTTYRELWKWIRYSG